MSDCEHRSGCGCCQCTSPAVTTELISGDPWAALFEYGPGWEDGFSGSGQAGDDPFLFTFTVTPGTTLPYYRVSFDNGDFDWDPDAVVITDENGNVVTPDDVFDAPHTFTASVDPTAMTNPGNYQGGLNIQRSANPNGPWGNETEKPVEVEITGAPIDAIVNHAQHDTMNVSILPYSGNPVYVMFPITKIGTGAATWSIEVDTDSWPAGSSYTLSKDGVALVEGTPYGPIVSGGYVWLMMTITHTNMVAGSTYTGMITINTETPVAHQDFRHFQVKFQVGDATHRFEIESPGPVTSGVAFPLVIRAIKLSTNLIDVDFQGGDLLFNLQSNPVDVANPLTVESAGNWAAGKYAVSAFSFTGTDPNPVLQVFDQLTRTQGMIALNSEAFALTINGGNDVSRGVNFDLEIQAVHTNGQLWTEYEPDGNVNITLTPADPADVIAPLLTNNTGWVDGKKTVPCTITGGTGSDAITIDADDVADLYNGSANGTINLAGFSVVINSGNPIQRGVAFNIVITKLTSTGITDVTYVPASTVNVDYTDTDGLGDTMTPLTTAPDGVAWVAGVRTLSCTVDGGTGSGDCSIDVQDATSGAIGLQNGTVGPAPAVVDHFHVTVPANVTRGTNFSITVEAMDASDNLVTTYVPASTVTLVLSSADAGDSMTPATIAAGSFSGGVATIANGNITGGTGNDAATIYANDTTTPAVTGNDTTIISSGVLLRVTYSGDGSFPIPSGSILLPNGYSNQWTYSGTGWPSTKPDIMCYLNSGSGNWFTQFIQTGTPESANWCGWQLSSGSPPAGTYGTLYYSGAAIAAKVTGGVSIAVV